MPSKYDFDPELIRRLETKMLPTAKGRDKNESPKLALTREEQLIYADYLEAISHAQSAAFFRK